MTSRRSFIKTSAIGGAGIMAGFSLMDAFTMPAIAQSPSKLYGGAYVLMQQWATALLALQVTDKSRTDDYGGIWCPADKAVHGRVGDAFYPMLYLADRTKDSKYLDSAMMLYRWIERRVSQPDGSWLNEPVKGSWKGTTVFAAIALAEALKNHGHLLDDAFKSELKGRLKKAGDYVCDNFAIDYGNINYPVTATYGLSLLGEILGEPRFKTKAKELANQALPFFTKKDGFLSGEGDPLYQPSKKGCFSVDLGYNVEESLPSLVMYGLLNKDEEILATVTHSLKTHLEFMLPDGAWDNSWGTRNYKWTYWGSRTSDGCQAAYALLAHREPVFYRAALKNMQLMQQLNVNGLLQGGPHNAARQVPVCVHHTFTHIKSLATMLDYGTEVREATNSSIRLPREKEYGYRFFSDVQTALIAKGNIRATVTGYDREYKKTKNGHATGGAITMLWHPQTGPIITGSMNDYQLYEAGNMQIDNDPYLMPLTPRIELKHDGVTYMNISYLDATMEMQKSGSEIIITATSRLVNKDQKSPPTGDVNCKVVYTFGPDKVSIKFSYDESAHDVKVIVPVIAKASEKIDWLSKQALNIHREKAMVEISGSHPIVQLPSTNGRIYNPIPGLEAIPLQIDGNNCTLVISVV